MHPEKEMAETKKENGLCKRELEEVAHRKKRKQEEEGGREKKEVRLGGQEAISLRRF